MGFLKEIFEDITGMSERPEIKGSRFEERSMNPDFLFRDKRTGEEFWIEAKYRNGLFRNEKGLEKKYISA